MAAAVSGSLFQARLLGDHGFPVLSRQKKDNNRENVAFVRKGVPPNTA